MPILFYHLFLAVILKIQFKGMKVIWFTENDMGITLSLRIGIVSNSYGAAPFFQSKLFFIFNISVFAKV